MSLRKTVLCYPEDQKDLAVPRHHYSKRQKDLMARLGKLKL